MTKLPIKSQFKRNFQAPLAAVYTAILALVVAIGALIITTHNIQQSQKLDSAAKEYSIVGCNQPCQHNHQCPADHFCFQGRCRLADNPYSSTCDPDEVITPTPSATIEPDISPTPPDEISPTPSPEPTPDEQPLIIDEEPIDEEPIDDLEPDEPTPTPTTLPEDDVVDRPFIFGIGQQISLLLNYVAADNGLSLLLALALGLIGLLVLISIVLLINAKQQSTKYQPTQFDIQEQSTFQEKSQSKRAQKIKTRPTTQSQPDSPSTKDNITPIKPNPQQQEARSSIPTPQEEDLTPPPSTMVSRLKEKEIDIPQNNQQQD